MSFIQPCFIKKNTPELRKKLEELGYIHIGISLSCIKTNKSGVSEQAEEYEINDRIDCETNEELFIALAALRDDTNANQWLTDGKIWGKFDEDSFLNPIQIINYLLSKGHKATVEEIMEHFKDK